MTSPTVLPDVQRKCGTCRHYRKNPQAIGQGVCVWGPPCAVPVMAGNVPSIMSARPPVSAADACGQWTEIPHADSN